MKCCKIGRYGTGAASKSLSHERREVILKLHFCCHYCTYFLILSEFVFSDPINKAMKPDVNSTRGQKLVQQVIATYFFLLNFGCKTNITDFQSFSS
jgi:hypothetical protein